VVRLFPEQVAVFTGIRTDPAKAVFYLSGPVEMITTFKMGITISKGNALKKHESRFIRVISNECEKS
jgi:hypothetical protein